MADKRTQAAADPQDAEDGLEELFSRESTRMHNPVLRLALSCLCMAFLIAAFFIGLGILIVEAISGSAKNASETTTVDKYSINRISTLGKEEKEEAADTAAYDWPFGKLLNASKAALG